MQRLHLGCSGFYEITRLFAFAEIDSSPVHELDSGYPLLPLTQEKVTELVTPGVSGKVEPVNPEPIPDTSTTNPSYEKDTLVAFKELQLERWLKSNPGQAAEIMAAFDPESVSVDNPFRPEGQLAKEADAILNALQSARNLIWQQQ